MKAISLPVRRPRGMRGMSLIELMIALVIGMLLILGLIQVFTASRAAYQLSEGLARAQENSRFAIDFLQRDLRLAGHFGCINDQAHNAQNPVTLTTTFAAVPVPALDFQRSIQGYEAVDTEPGGAITVAASPAAGAGDYAPALPTQYADALDNRIAGSDIVVLRYLAPEGVPITLIEGTPAAPQFDFDSSRWSVLSSGVNNPGLFGVADCLSATVFQAKTVNPGGGIVLAGDAPNNVSTFSSVFTAGQAVLYRAESLVYYVGLNDVGQPSLYRVRFVATPSGALDAQKEELVEGVENMQLLYGQDRELDPNRTPTGYIDRQSTADTVDTSMPAPADAWRRVGAIQVGLVMRSPDISTAPQASGDAKLISLGVGVTAPEDGRYRSVYQTTVALRNRLYGN